MPRPENILKPFQVVEHPVNGFGTIPAVWSGVSKMPEVRERGVVLVRYWNAPKEELPIVEVPDVGTCHMTRMDLVDVQPFPVFSNGSIVTLENKPDKYLILDQEELTRPIKGVRCGAIPLTGPDVGARLSLSYAYFFKAVLTIDEYLDCYNAFKTLPLISTMLSRPERDEILRLTRPIRKG